MLLIEFLTELRSAIGDVRLLYVHPVLHVVVIDDEFAGEEDEVRRFLFRKRIKTQKDQLSFIESELQISLLLVTSEEWQGDYSYIRQRSSGNHWLALFDAPMREKWAAEVASSSPDINCRAIHFYGFKGGQARSTVLVALARFLAASGYKVLMVDADLEAPTLSTALDSKSSSISSSLVGVVQGKVPEPLAVDQNSLGGALHLLQARPSINQYDLDYASFVLRMNLDSDLLHRSIENLKKNVAEVYDFVLFDHRTGMATSVLPIVNGWPGSVVINMRADGLSEGQHSVVSSLLAVDRNYPGAFVCFSLDPEKKKGALSAAEFRLKQEMLELMAVAIERGAELHEPLDPDDLDDYFVSWYHDRAFLDSPAPQLEAISVLNAGSLRQLRDILGISAQPQPGLVPREVIKDIYHPRQSPSGALDDGWFLETPDAVRLLQASLPSYYVYGRKGTGKTRLFRELAVRGLARPMHSSVDFPGATLSAQGTLARSLIDLVEEDYEKFWWIILAAELHSAAYDVSASDTLEDWVESSDLDPSRPSYSAQLASQIAGRVVVAIDGIETAVEASKTARFVEALFRFLSAVQNDSIFSEKVRFRLFIRADLPVGLQNIEQQVHGRKLDLRWDEGSIFHYFLAELARSDWFRANFREVCEKIDSLNSEIRLAKLSSEQCETLLLGVFPQKLRRNNLLTMTFLRTYFSDAAGDGDSKASFYPRVFGRFIAEIARIGRERGAGAIDKERVAHGVVHEAFELAARDFINEVKQELNFALELSDSVEANKMIVSDLLQAFAGLLTPFVLDKCVQQIALQMPAQIGSAKIREALRRMKEMGIFEVHPGDATKWRAGRLFKEGLGMKYVRRMAGGAAA
ncbi:AAA family ATPase [Stenotrophomonas bentonitica]|uniref:AAA family ATPase n=1 Tax=Stenotrophomonas bentonitica TaxID=1450134 RepID=UPI0036E153BB